MWVFIVFLLWIISHMCPARAPQFEIFFWAGRGSLFPCRAGAPQVEAPIPGMLSMSWGLVVADLGSQVRLGLSFIPDQDSFTGQERLKVPNFQVVIEW